MKLKSNKMKDIVAAHNFFATALGLDDKLPKRFKSIEDGHQKLLEIVLIARNDLKRAGLKELMAEMSEDMLETFEPSIFNRALLGLNSLEKVVLSLLESYKHDDFELVIDSISEFLKTEDRMTITKTLYQLDHKGLVEIVLEVEGKTVETTVVGQNYAKANKKLKWQSLKLESDLTSYLTRKFK